MLKGIAAHLVMKAEGRVELMTEQRDMLTELVRPHRQAGSRRAGAGLPTTTSRRPTDDAGRLRVVVDQVASLTDPSSVEKHRRLRGGAA